jgi:two-component system, OmpR family, sensor histidine kinase KdpD
VTIAAMRAHWKWDRAQTRRAAEICGEVVLAVAAATVVVALLQSAAPPAGLGVVYLLAVLEVAVRRGQAAALAAAVLGVLTLNYLFIAPRHQLLVRHTQDLIALIVLLIAAVVVGRLAELGRAQAREAESRARVATAREQEATLLAEAASAILAGHSVRGQFAAIEKLVETATGTSRARIVAEPVPSPRDGEVTVRLRAQQHIWLYVANAGGWGGPSQLERLAEPLGKLLDVAAERERVAERAAENEAARRTETARTAVLHAISHDLRSPLTAITTAISALRSDQVSVDERGELIEVIDGESVRLAKLVDDLLDLSKIQAGAVAPRADWCDLSDVVASAIAHLPASQPIELALPLDLPLVQADAAQLERVFSNLLENAVKFSPPGAPVRITGGAAAGRVTVRVTDRGRGIPAQQRGRVFEPFFRGRTDRSPDSPTPSHPPPLHPGSGLGLAIVKGFVEANGGRILLQSGTDQGTSFAVSFPVARQPAPAGS